MREIDVESAIRDIVGTTQRKQAQIEKGRSGCLPFFFIVGAGISHPPIPLAEGIEKLCRDALRPDRPLPPRGLAPLDNYAATFEAAFPSAEDRQDFLHNLLHKMPISVANLRLAHLLGERKLTNLVVTPNFDEMLSQALRLLGYHDVVICDHPKTTQRIRLNRTSQIQIVHVHGTHWFYDCCNLRGEIENRAEYDEHDELGMLGLLDKVLGDRSPLVVGYSGWENDVIMTALKGHLRLETLPHNIYWFCYQREDIYTLPTWLHEHASVRVVLPPISAVELAKKRLESSFAAAQDFEATGSSEEAALSAARIFGLFIQQMALSQPALTKNPIAFVADTLRADLALAAADKEDIYLLREVLRRVQHGALLEGESRSATSEALQRVNDAIRRLALDEAVGLAARIDFRCLTPEEQEELDSTLDKVIRGAEDLKSESALLACDARLRLCEVVAASADNTAAPWSERTAQTLLRKGFLHFTMGQHEKELAAYDEVLCRFGDAHEPTLREQAAKALRNKALALAASGAVSEAKLVYEEILHRFGNAAELAVREQVAQALVNKGVALATDSDFQGAVAACDEVLLRFGDSGETALREQVAKALRNKGLALRAIGERDAEDAAFEELVRRFGKSPEPALHDQVAWALFNRDVLADYDEQGRS